MNGSVTKIELSLHDFFVQWIKLTRPFHKLNEREMNVLSSLLRKRHELGLKILDNELIDSFLFDSLNIKSIASELGMSKESMAVSMSILRKNGIVKDNSILKRFVPDIKIDKGEDAEFQYIVTMLIKN